MFEELNNRRKAVEQNIVKSFVDDNDIEKAREKKTFSIGDTFTRHGITYRCTGISPNTGRPTWSKVSGGAEKPKEEEQQKEDKKRKIEIPKRISDKELSSSKENVKSLYKSGEKLWDLFKNTIVDLYKNTSDDPIKAEKYGKESLNSCEKIYEKFGWRQLENYSIPQGWWIYVDKLNSVKDEEQKPKKETKQIGKLSDLQVGDEVEIVEDNKGKITKKKGKITKVNAASFEVGGERFYKRTGYHVGMDNVKIQIPK